MKAKTEELLYLLLWRCDKLFRPTFQNLDSSFESWAYRNGFLRRLHELEAQKFIESRTTPADARVLRLSEAGRLHALGGRDPEERWIRPWDGQWRLVIYDVPVDRDSERRQLRRYLRSRHFGYLQNSVWISPDPLTEEREKLRGAAINVESLVLLDALPGAGESNEEIVAGSWDFAGINRAYQQYLEVLGARPETRLRSTTDVTAFRRWAHHEQTAWREAVEQDPLLPRALLPSDYLGVTAWQRRLAAAADIAEQLASFQL